MGFVITVIGLDAEVEGQWGDPNPSSLKHWMSK